jgi:Tfp pilus assembly protein FimV
MPFQYLTDLPIDRTTVLVALLVVASCMTAIALMVFRRRLASADRRPGAARARAHAHRADAPADTQSTQSGETRPLSDFGGMVEVHRHLPPLTEAEVFMALGKDREAESLLLEAISRSPSNLSLRVKLAEVYTQRPDIEAFQSVAFKLRLITGARGQVWENICTMGRHVDPGNPEYQNMEAAAQGTSAFAPQYRAASDFADTVMSTQPVLQEVRWH